MHQRNSSSGQLEPRDHLFSGPLHYDDLPTEKKENFFQSGGAGLFAKPKAYTKILAALLNGGTSPTTGKSILNPHSVDLMFENQIPDQPNFARAALPPSANPLIASQTPELYPQPNNPPQGWAFGGFLTIEPGPSGRGANTLWWMGVTNCFWWLDREKGVAGLLAGQVLPSSDPKIVPTWFMCEKAIYDNLE